MEHQNLIIIFLSCECEHIPTSEKESQTSETRIDSSEKEDEPMEISNSCEPKIERKETTMDYTREEDEMELDSNSDEKMDYSLEFESMEFDIEDENIY